MYLGYYSTLVNVDHVYVGCLGVLCTVGGAFSMTGKYPLLSLKHVYAALAVLFLINYSE